MNSMVSNRLLRRQKTPLRFLTFMLFSLIPGLSLSQTDPAKALDLDLEDTGEKIENVITLQLAEKQYEALHSSRGRKMEFNTDAIVVNGDTLKPRKIRTRGQSSLMFRRKSLTIKLKSKASFRHCESAVPLKRFYLLSLSMDKYYCHNRLAFEMMDSLGLFSLFYSYGELVINGRSEGIFMVMERPEDWAIREKGSPVVIRRGPDHAMDEVKTDQSGERGASKKYLDIYRDIYSALDHYSGRELFDELSKSLDLGEYMKWMAFNFLIHNGDYSDEVFFYFDPAIQKYRIIPWDYDDILAATPHEGIRLRNQLMGEKLIFSGEDLLDEKIGTDAYLYDLYLDRLREVLELLSPELIKGTIESTFSELYPYYVHPEVIINAQYDQYDNASLDHLRDYLLQVYRLLLDYSDIYRNMISP